MNNIQNIQEALREEQVDGWLFYSFRNSDPFAGKILGLSEGHFTRRWFYFIPTSGEPVKIVHAIEQDKLNVLEGEKKVYLTWKELHEKLFGTLKGVKKVAMQYSPMNDIPYISLTDAGTVELIRSLGCEVESSAVLVAKFESVLTERQREDFIEASELLRSFVDDTFNEIKRRINDNSRITEYDVQRHILNLFEKNNLVTSSYPVAAINENSADPHYEPSEELHKEIRKGDFLLIDLWAKKNTPRSIYADITWTGYIGESVPEKFERIFQIAKKARNRVIETLEKKCRDKDKIYGWELDDAARNVIKDAGFGQFFIHRTGHSIGENVHGNGANLDNLETRDTRVILPQTCFSIEPGIYIKGDFGVRTEIDLYIEKDFTPALYGTPFQEHVIPILR